MTLLAELSRYYGRLLDEEPPPVPPAGFSSQKLSFVLILDREGRLQGEPLDFRDTDTKGKPVPREEFLPFPGGSRTSGIKPYFLWDKSDYVLGVAAEKGTGDKELSWTPSPNHFQAFATHLREVAGQSDDAGIRAVLAFLDDWQPERFERFGNWRELLGQNLAFRLEEERRLVHQRPEVQRLWLKHLSAAQKEMEGTCLVSGEFGPVQRLHGAIKGIPGAQSSGASLVSFNADAFCSYGKDQSYNAPVGVEAEHGYTSALNFLLRRESDRKIRVGNTVIVFWCEAPSVLEDVFFGALENNKADDPSLNKKLETLFQRFERLGDQADPDPDLKPDARFFVLGLAPNAARLSVRFWLQHRVDEMVSRLKRHFQDLAIVRRFENQPVYPGISRLLLHLAAQYKFDNIPGTLTGEVLRAVFSGREYPRSMLQAAITRCRVEQDITYERAAVIKAWLARHARATSKFAEVPMSLDVNRTDPPYRMGRLFAACEKAQEDAAEGSLNRTVRDRFFGSAMATPAVVFPQLIKLASYHIDKIRKSGGRRRNYDRLIGEIIDAMNGFPKFLSLEEQGLFALGYYHQRQDFFKKHGNEGEDHD